MSGNFTGCHRKQRLLFFVAQDVSADIRDAVRSQLDGLAKQGDWLIQPPMFVDTVDNAGTRDEDIPDATVGGVLEIHSALDGTLPHDIDRVTLAEVERMVAAAKELSSSLSLEIEFTMDGEFVGAIDDGQIDQSLAVGLLGEWRRHLELAK